MDTKEAIIYCENNKIEGCYVECGVAAGRHPCIACNTILQNNFKKWDIYMYDTYEGLTKPGKYDYSTENPLCHRTNKQIIDEWNSLKTTENRSTWCYVPLEVVKKNVYDTTYPKDKLYFIKGDVMETLKDKKTLPEKIAILRLDTDWYESSKFELEQLYDRVVTGGVIILDDYFQWDGQRRATDEFLKENNITKTIIRNNQQTGYFIK
jgi:O-methyltransferase